MFIVVCNLFVKPKFPSAAVCESDRDLVPVPTRTKRGELTIPD